MGSVISEPCGVSRRVCVTQHLTVLGSPNACLARQMRAWLAKCVLGSPNACLARQIAVLGSQIIAYRLGKEPGLPRAPVSEGVELAGVAFRPVLGPAPT
jgi:hypothetical protein